MRMIFRFCIIAVLHCFALSVSAADSTGIRWDYVQERINDNEVLLSIKAVVPPGVKLYGLSKTDADALYSSIAFDSSANKYLAGKIVENGASKSENDATINAVVTYYKDSVLWQQKINAKSTDSLVLKGKVTYLYKKGEEYLPGEEKFKFAISPENDQLTTTTSNDTSVGNRSLLWIFLTAFGGGLLALLTPCVYSMIPVTVSFFTKRSKSKADGIKNALYYSTSIVFIFTLLGFLITLIFGPAALNNLATNWIANLVFFALFLVFGISFLGAFDITLPSSWSTGTDRKAGTGNFLGIFFMALTLAVVSFSCTGPIIGNLLVLAAKGSYWGAAHGNVWFFIGTCSTLCLVRILPI